MQFDLIPVGQSVRVHSRLSDIDTCQVIDIHVDKTTGQVLYALGHFVDRQGFLSRWPKKVPLHHLVRGEFLEVIE